MCWSLSFFQRIHVSHIASVPLTGSRPQKRGFLFETWQHSCDRTPPQASQHTLHQFYCERFSTPKAWTRIFLPNVILWCATRSGTDRQLLPRNVSEKLQPNWGKRMLSRKHHEGEQHSQRCFRERTKERSPSCHRFADLRKVFHKLCNFKLLLQMFEKLGPKVSTCIDINKVDKFHRFPRTSALQAWKKRPFTTASDWW